MRENSPDYDKTRSEWPFCVTLEVKKLFSGQILNLGFLNFFQCFMLLWGYFVLGRF